MADTPLTLMAVHAHPDDEATSTGGILARYSAEGIRTVLVTCTNGELGDALDGVKPGDPGHDETAVVALRRAELEASRAALGITHLEMLGYHDSGMAGWDANDAPGAFAAMPVDVAARPLLALIEKYRPDVVVTYDDFGFYGHPDHIQAHRITVAALRSSGSPARLYFPAIRRSRLAGFRDRMIEMGMEPPEIDETRMGQPDEDIVATVDCRAYAAAKFAAVSAHASQAENLFFIRFELPVFTEVFGTEEFVRGNDAVPQTATPVDDLFAGLRQPATR
ncbi:MAG TPA: PIG-L family deacetylase [Candidatus Dormibacteraeota bacterium]|jgi:LmbE family N-acetylglucosaminyl deacetylase|nr:PIG-L family deacetylase [Candidatus Dormibacteraeota bacterium]